LAYTNEAQLTLEFPLQSMPLGKGLCLDPPPEVAPKERQWLSAGSVAELAMELMSVASPASLDRDADKVRVKFVQEIPSGTEPNTGQSLPYSPDGGFMDLLAAHGMLAEVAAIGESKPGSTAPFLLQTRLKRDWLSWLPVAEDHDVERRAATFAAIGCFLRREPEWRITGALFQAGLAADRGLAQWRTSKGFQAKTPRLLEVLDGLRNGLYSRNSKGIAANWLSPVRIFGVNEVSAEQSTEGLAVSWRPDGGSSSSWSLIAPFGMQLLGCKGANLALHGSYEGVQFFWAVPSEKFAPIRANFRIRGRLQTMPRLVPFTGYTETQR
jgi:hypothetical protein